MEKIKIIYILGTGHSGSTLLDIFLGSPPGGESLGEIIWINQWINQRDKHRCSCRSNLHAYELWGAALSGWLANISSEGLVAYKTTQPKFEIPKSPSFFMLFRQRYLENTDFQTYAKLTYQLFKNIQAVNKAQYLVDSSKYPSRAFSLLNNPYLDVFIIHLIRDPRAVANSAIKRRKSGLIHPRWGRPTHTWRDSLGWEMNKAQCDVIVKEAGNKRSISVKYQDFVLQPKKTHNAIDAKVKINIDDLITAIETDQPIHRKYLVSGNGIRRHDTIKLKADLTWADEIPAFSKILSWAIAGRRAQKYGFKW